MDQPHTEQPESAAEAKPRTDWLKPEIVTLDAGSAEVGDAASADGNIAS
ncbi:MAG: hypothetical protein ACK40O_11660 [Allosphingosinicella sp.]